MNELPDVNLSILDGGLGVVSGGSSGVQVKVGVSSSGSLNEIISVSDPSKIRTQLGTGPLANAYFDSISAGAKAIYAIRAESDIAGTVGQITAQKTGIGDLAASGSPLDAYDVIVTIIDSGAKNEATFQVSLDGGDNYAPKVTVPTDLIYVIPNTGITLTFTEDGVTPSNSFIKGDAYSFKTTAPGMSVTSLNTALEVIFGDNRGFEFIHVVGESDVSVWAALDARATVAESNFRYIHFVGEAAAPTSEQTIDQWVTSLIASASEFSSRRVNIVASLVELSDFGSGLRIERNVAGILNGRASSQPVQRSVGRVEDGSLPGVIRLAPKGISEAHIAALDEAGYTTVRNYVGLSGVYATNGRMMSPSGSDFEYWERRRVMDKACTLVRAAALRLGHAELEDAEQVADVEARLFAPIGVMIGNGEIAAGQVFVAPGQDILATSTLRFKVRVRPIGIMRFLEGEIGYGKGDTE